MPPKREGEVGPVLGGKAGGVKGAARCSERIALPVMFARRTPPRCLARAAARGGKRLAR
jgi:hypothetical protein